VLRILECSVIGDEGVAAVAGGDDLVRILAGGRARDDFEAGEIDDGHGLVIFFEDEEAILGMKKCGGNERKE
jgi:hypothetical protein